MGCGCWTDSIQVVGFDMPEISKEDFKEIETKIEKMTGFRPYKYKEIKLRRDMHKINGTYYQFNKGLFIKYAIDEFNKIENKEKINKLDGINIRRDMHKINGTYYQFNKGCILYSIINNGHIDEQFIPDSMKYYVDHSHKEDQRNDTDFLKKIMSIIDLAQLWMNIGGECPYLEINLNEVRNRIYFVLKDFFDYEEKEESEKMKKENLEKKINEEENITNIPKAKTNVLKKVFEMTWQSKD